MTLPENAIAIVGISGRFPGADTVGQFWDNTRRGVTSITRFTNAELEDSFPAEVREAANFVRARAILPDVDRFDAEFFGILPRVAALTDPQHRLLLECAWSALEDAGCDPAHYPGPIGVFAGCSLSTYLLTNVLAGQLDPGRFASEYQVGSYDALLGALPDTLATRIAYRLNLRGPAVTVQSACSTSLLAIAQACQSLLLGQSDMALAGGVSITFPQKRGYLHQEGGMVSADGICRPFDDEATGTVFGDGVAVVALKRLADAVDDRDHIYAVIRGTAINNDGSGKVGFTAPSVQGQAEVIATALAVAGVDAGSIGYVECHGTATPLGDPIELAGLQQGFGMRRAEQPFCAIGSAKANVGHLDAAAGIVGLIRAVLALQNREIPPLANFRRLNRHIDAAGSPFYFPTAARPWSAGDEPRRAGVSSFGVGGTNVHAVLEEAPEIERTGGAARRHYVLPLSARNDTALRAAATALADDLAGRPDVALDDVAFTLQAGRRAFAQRAAIACASREQAIEALTRLPATTRASDDKPPLVFMFPGQGAQFPGMAGELYEAHAVFRTLIDQGIEIAGPIVGDDLRSQLLDRDAAGGDATRLTQPALFIFEYAQARLWIEWGLQPASLVGHSVGEFVAACLAGVFSFEEGCRLVAGRARIMQAMPTGAMLAVRLPERELVAELGAGLDLAAVNAPSLCVAAGPMHEIEALEARLAARDVPCRRLAVSHAFHSRAVDAALAEFAASVPAVRLQPPRIPFVSTITGNWITAAQAVDPTYWVQHARAPVRFADALATAAREGRPYLLEVGPGRTLASLAPQIVARSGLRGVTASMPDADAGDLSDAMAAVWTAGLPLDWSAAGARGRKISLPTYPFQRVRCWIDPASRGQIPPPRLVSPVPSTPALPSVAATPARASALQAELIGIFHELSGVTDIDPEAEFVAQGFDSLLLGQAARAIEKKFRTKITFRQLLNETTSVAALAAHLEQALPAQPAIVTALATPSAEASDGATAALFRAQLEAMQALFAEQLRALHGQSPAPEPETATDESADGPAGGPPMPAPRLARGRSDPLTPRQQDYIKTLAQRINARTPLSKARTQRDRDVLADPRTAAGFRREWKELVYPIVADRARGSKIRDIDGNEYVDLVNGFGQTMFGHSPDFVTQALAAQIEEGFPIGPQTPLAGEVAALIRDMTASERVTFCNTGSEAVMAAMRVARTVTGRERVVVFNNDYHGQFDEALVRAAGGTGPRALPVAPGIPPGSIANMTVLPYGQQWSLDWIAANGSDIAAVLVEPVQSRHPLLRPVEFLKRLRSLCDTSGAALVFDEIVTGFRVHQGGMQAVFGITADLATYGKVVGGGMPIGILAGKAQFMDALDGGTWRYGDDSVPEAAATFVAGTFVRHPLALAAAKAVLLHLKAEGPALQERLAGRMDRLVASLNRNLERRGLSVRAEGYSSWFHINFAAEGPLAALFWPQMRLLGVHVQEGFPCFLTTAHSDADIAAIENAFAVSLDALEAGGILGGERRASGPTPVAMPAEGASAPLTEPQLEILTAAQMGEDASCTFNESVSIALDGALDPAALETALNAVIARHDALRGRVGRSDERMHFAARLELDLQVHDCSDEPDPEVACAAFVAADARTPFDLWSGPLVRAALMKLAAQRHVLVLTAHHIVCDGWSTNIILQELATAYRERAALPDAPSFAQYARDEASSTAEKAADLAYWTQLYRDIPPLPELPTDRPRPQQRSYAGATYTTSFDATLLANLRKVAAANGATLFATLFTALQVVIGRLTGTSDVVIGVPVAAQASDGHPDLVGHCVRMLPFRSPLDWDSPFSSAVRTAAGRLADGFDHAACTYGTLVRALPLQRVADRLPLTEIQFNLERLSTATGFGDLSVEVTPNAKAAVTFDLCVNIIESAAGLRIDCDYSTDLFDQTTIARWMEHYRLALEGIVAAPGTPLGALELLSSEQARFVLDAVNETAAAYPGESGIHDLFAAQAARTPERIACVDGTGSLTYSELDRRSTALARALLQASPVRQGRIALAVDRSSALLVGLLGIMKAGHAYVPLDARQPIERLRQIAMSARIDGIVYQDANVAAIAPGAFALRLDRLDAPAANPASGPELPRVPTDASVYVLFTSGSTGAPKGVEVSHRALTNTLSAMSRLWEITADDVVVASSAVTVDASIPELFIPLMMGARVVLADSETVLTGFELVALADRSGATAMLATPTLWRILLEAGFASRPGLKMVAAGEPLPRDLADRLLAGGGRLWNLYGPTETAICASGSELAIDGAAITIGRPIANVQLYVLDERDRIAPPGAFGMLFIGGDGLAKGYFDRPDLTARAFREIALAGRAPRRLYSTGDRARLLPSGAFELSGRSDRQIKLRGFRIELEEIESVLRQTPGVRDCAVLLRHDIGPDPALVAYVVPAGGDAAALKADLARRLPDYMVPTRWVGLDALPLTAGSKLDRNALPRPAEEPRPIEPPAARTETPLEATIAAVWTEVLGRTGFGVEDPLFSVGADSLHVFRIAARLQRQGIAIDARDLMKNPTIAALARKAQEKGRGPRTESGRMAPALADFRRGARRRSVSS